MVEESNTPKKTSEADVLLGWIDRYVTLVQNAPYARRMQVAMLWSAASLLYLAFGLKVESSSTATLLGVSIGGIDHGKFCIFLLVMTSYYTLMFGFVFAKVWSVSRPVRLFRRLFQYTKKRVGGGTVFVEGAEGAVDMALGFWEAVSDVPPEFFDGSEVTTFRSMKSEDELRHFMVGHPLFGLLENLFARMLFPALVCIGALAWLVAEIFFESA